MSNGTSFSTHNQQVLSNYSRQLWEGINNLEPPAPKPSITSAFRSAIGKLYSWMPGRKTIGQTAGMAIVRTHGAESNKKVIQFVYEKLFGKHMGSSMAIEGINLATSPYLLPVLEKLGITAGGISVTAAVWLCSFLYGKAFSSPDQSVTIFDAPEIDKLLVQDEDGIIYDSIGNPLGEEDIKFIRKTIARMNIVSKLIEADRETLVDVLCPGYITARSDNINFDNINLYYTDGTKISEEDFEIIEKAVATLTENSNIQMKSKHIEKMINRLAKHTLLNPKSEFIIFEDGIISDKNGMVVSQEEYENAIEEKANLIEKIIEEFEVIENSGSPDEAS